jgi:ABC-type antimicrobial peptide transport system permease subunit
VATLRDAAVGPLRRITTVVVSLGALALALASVGLYGSIAFFTAQRARDIAIRMAVGAPRARVLHLLLGHGLRVVGAGTAIGVAAVWMAYRFMGGMIFGQWRLDVAALCGVIAVFALTTLAACYVPGRRASRIDPMTVLRSE